MLTLQTEKERGCCRWLERVNNIVWVLGWRDKTMFSDGVTFEPDFRHKIVYKRSRGWLETFSLALDRLWTGRKKMEETSEVHTEPASVLLNEDNLPCRTFRTFLKDIRFMCESLQILWTKGIRHSSAVLDGLFGLLEKDYRRFSSKTTIDCQQVVLFTKRQLKTLRKYWKTLVAAFANFKLGVEPMAKCFWYFKVNSKRDSAQLPCTQMSNVKQDLWKYAQTPDGQNDFVLAASMANLDLNEHAKKRKQSRPRKRSFDETTDRSKITLEMAVADLMPPSVDNVVNQ